MKRKKVTQRDPFGREQSTFEEKDDDGSGPFDSRTGLLKDGRSVRVSMMMRDSLPPATGSLLMYDVPPGRTITHAKPSATPGVVTVDSETPAMVVDAFGSVEGLNRPGARYLIAGHRTEDHAVMTTLAVMRDEAYRLYDEEAQNAWRGNNKLECVPDCKTDALPAVDAREQAYAEYDRMMAEAWKNA